MLGIAPYEEVAQRIAVELWLQHPRPPCGVGQVLQAALGQCQQLAMLLCVSGQHLQVGVQLPHIVFLRAPLIGIQPYEVHPVVAGIALQELLLGAVAVEVGAVAPHQVVEALAEQVVLQHAPQGVILAQRTLLGTPPEPAAIVLVPRSEDNGNGLSLLVLQCRQEVAHTLHPP